MKHKSMFLIAVGILLFTVLFDLIAQHFFLYYTFVWLDLAVHFIASIGLGIAALWSIFFSSWGVSLPRSNMVFVIVSLFIVVVAGLFWEWFEYSRNLIEADNYVLDTSLDVLMDIAGALTAGWYVSRRRINLGIK